MILTEYHESARVDRQLFGRAARQGDPGSCEACVSLADELYVQHAPRLARLVRKMNSEGAVLGTAATIILRLLAQARAEKKNAAVRRQAIRQDETMSPALAFSGRAE